VGTAQLRHPRSPGDKRRQERAGGLRDLLPNIRSRALRKKQTKALWAI